MKDNTQRCIGSTLQTIFLVLGVYFCGRIIRNNFYYVYISEPVKLINPALGEALTYLGHIVFIILTLMYFYFVKEERYCLEDMKLTKDNKGLIYLALGLAIGFIMNAIAVSAAIMNGDIDMNIQNFDFGMLLLIFICIFIQSSAEEISVRILGYSRIIMRSGLGYAVIGSSVAFALEHMLNRGISAIAMLNIFLVGVFYALSIYYFGSFWFACGCHAAWNFTQNCIFGLPNSGNPALISVMAPSFTNKSFFYDPDFGIEGTLIVSILNIVAITVLLFLIRKKYKKS